MRPQRKKNTGIRQTSPFKIGFFALHQELFCCVCVGGRYAHPFYRSSQGGHLACVLAETQFGVQTPPTRTYVKHNGNGVQPIIGHPLCGGLLQSE